MGCFNVNGAISNLPISYGDEAVAIIGLYSEKINYGQEFSPGYDFTPLFFPVVGTYDDYGCLENIVEDINTQFIKDFFEIDDICKILSLIDDNAEGRYCDDEEESLWKQMDKKIQDLINEKRPRYLRKNEKFQLGYTMEHKFVYDFFATQNHNDGFFGIDIDKSYEETLKVNSQHDLSLDGDRLSMTDKYLLSNKISSMFRDSRMIYLGTRTDIGFIGRGTGYMYNEYFMHPYSVREDILLCPENKENYIKFVKFFYTLTKLQIVLRQHNYAGQSLYYETFLEYHEKCCNFLKEKIEENE